MPESAKDWSIFDHEIEANYPWITWREPVVIRTPGTQGGFACRLCIARYGFSPQKDYDRLFPTLQEFAAHMRETHGTE